MHSLKCTAPHAARLILTAFALTLLLSGCAKWAAPTNALPPAPRTPGAIVTDEYICIPHNEAAELMLWIEYAEGVQ